MEELLAGLDKTDLAFVVALIRSSVNLTDDDKLSHLLQEVEQNDAPGTRAALNRQIEHEVRYLGSAEIAYYGRMVLGSTPGVSFNEIIRDAANVLKVPAPRVGSASERVRTITLQYASQRFSDLSREEQQHMLMDLGVDREQAASFLRTSAGVFAVPALIQAFGTVVVDGLIRGVVFGGIARLLGRRLSMQIFRLLASRFPWWIRWIAPVAWSASLGWAVLDLQGPALRKTVPLVLYLGLCSLRTIDAPPAPAE